MKSLTAVCPSGASMPAINPSGRAIGRHQHPHRENAEMKMYLSKLKDLVPFMPKNRKLSKLEIIQHVIDYICDLQSELETHPEMGGFDAATALNFAASQNMPMDEDDEFAADDEAQEQTPNGAAADADGADEDQDALVRRLAAESRQQQHQQRPQHQLQQQHAHHRQQQQQQQQQHSSPAATRQPLVDRQAPNTILPAPAVSASSANVAVVVQSTPVQQQPQVVAPSAQTTSGDKDSRQASC